MQIRRPLAALLLAAALAGGAGSLTGCIAPSAGRTGTPADNASTTPGGSPASDSLPDNSGREITTGGRSGGANG